MTGHNRHDGRSSGLRCQLSRRAKTAKEVVLPLSVAALIIYHLLVTR
jgi:hypothetical protein